MINNFVWNFFLMTAFCVDAVCFICACNTQSRIPSGGLPRSPGSLQTLENVSERKNIYVFVCVVMNYMIWPARNHHEKVVAVRLQLNKNKNINKIKI